jgi:hypothetical protein
LLFRSLLCQIWFLRAAQGLLNRLLGASWMRTREYEQFFYEARNRKTITALGKWMISDLEDWLLRSKRWGREGRASDGGNDWAGPSKILQGQGTVTMWIRAPFECVFISALVLFYLAAIGASLLIPCTIALALSGAQAKGNCQRRNRIGVEPEGNEGQKPWDRRWRRLL